MTPCWNSCFSLIATILCMKMKSNLSIFKILEEWKWTIDHEQSLLFGEIRRTSQKNRRKQNKKKEENWWYTPSETSPWSEAHENFFHPNIARIICLWLVLYSCSLNIACAQITQQCSWRVFHFLKIVQIKEYDLVLLVTLNTHFLLVKR